MIARISSAALSASVVLAAALPVERPYRRATYVMGTVATLTVYAGGEAQADEYSRIAFGELRRIDSLLTNYRDSELTQLNARAAAGPVPVSPELYDVVNESIALSRRYGGAFDITVGPALRAWGFFGEHPRVSTADLRARIGCEKIELDPALRTVRFVAPGMEIDLGGAAKGYAVERAARLLERAGVVRALVSLGESSLYAVGAPPGESGWPVAVRDVRDPARVAEVVLLPPGYALSTSGTYVRRFRSGGREYSHLFDPKTARPIAVRGSATVICRSGLESEAAAKAVLLLGPAYSPPDTILYSLRMTIQDGGLVSIECRGGACESRIDKHQARHNSGAH